MSKCSSMSLTHFACVAAPWSGRRSKSPSKYQCWWNHKQVQLRLNCHQPPGLAPSNLCDLGMDMLDALLLRFSWNVG